MNSSARDLKSPESPHATLHGRAMENLRYIRTTMERSESYTHVSGMGVAATGVVALIAWGFAITASSDLVWLAVWLEAAAASLALAVYTLARKSRTEGRAVLRERGRVCPEELGGVGARRLRTRPLGMSAQRPERWGEG